MTTRGHVILSALDLILLCVLVAGYYLVSAVEAYPSIAFGAGVGLGVFLCLMGTAGGTT